MSVRADLTAQLARYDDETWAGLASRGLLRRARKDLDAGTEVVVVADDADVLRLRVGGQEVALDHRGPAHAVCSCPSVSVCQHVVAAGLWLVGAGGRTEPDAPSSGGEPPRSADGRTPADSEPADRAAADLHEALMAFDDPALVAHAGAAGLRWARQYVADLDLHTDVRVGVGRHLSIAFTRPSFVVRYVGGGVEALVVDSHVPRPERYRVAAVLAYQAAHGVVVAAPPSRAAGRHAGSGLEEARARLRASVARLAVDTVSIGLAHPSAGIAERYRTGAVGAQGVEYHRLARLLRGLADQVEHLMNRAARADEERLLDDIALVYALVTALGAAAAAGDAPGRLLGTARNRFDQVRTMDLVGLGAVPWRAPSGYRGLTSVLWWPDRRRFVSVTDARPEGVLSFDARARYEAPGPWTGLDSPSAATGARVLLSGAQLSAEGRLSAAEGTRAAVRPLSGIELAERLHVVDVWSSLERGGRSLLDLPDALAEWAVLRPTGWAPARFDEADQVLDWVLSDASGDEVRLRVPYTAENAHLVDVLEHLTASGWPEQGTLVVCRLRRGRAGVLAGEPMSLVHPRRPAGEAVEALHFTPARRDAGRRRGRAASRPVSPDRREQLVAGSGSRTFASPVTEAHLPTEVADLRAWLLRRAERGTAGATEPTTEELARRHRQLRGVGFTLFPADPRPGPGVGDSDGGDPAAAAVLRSTYLVAQLTALVADPVPDLDDAPAAGVEVDID